jgi:hypothetical protein
MLAPGDMLMMHPDMREDWRFAICIAICDIWFKTLEGKLTSATVVTLLTDRTKLTNLTIDEVQLMCTVVT